MRMNVAGVEVLYGSQFRGFGFRLRAQSLLHSKFVSPKPKPYVSRVSRMLMHLPLERVWGLEFRV